MIPPLVAPHPSRVDPWLGAQSAARTFETLLQHPFEDVSASRWVEYGFLELPVIRHFAATLG